MTTYKALNCQITGIGAFGPGFVCWSELIPYLADEQAFCDRFSTPKPQLIPSNERRRAPLPVRLAIETSHQALEMAGKTSPEVACVFGSGLGDTQITDYLCRALNSEQQLVSPTKFHNSVHNAAAGYWTISTGCMLPANSIAASHYTLAVALLESICQCAVDQVPVLMTLFDIPVPQAMSNALHNPYPFSASILLEPANLGIAGIADIESKPSEAVQPMQVNITARSREQSSDWPDLKYGALRSVYRDNPAAKSLLLLEKLILGDSGPHLLPLSSGSSLELTLQTGCNTSPDANACR